MSPVRAAVLLVGTVFSVAFIGMTAVATGAFFWPPQTVGELLADGFTIAGVAFFGMILLAIWSAIREPPEPPEGPAS
jgi:hypothetical protein